jgi:hypothetical protein
MGRRTPLRLGTRVPRSGQYQQAGPRGGQGKEVTSVKGERLHPTPKKRMTYRLIGLGQFFLLSFRDDGGELLHPKRLP